MLAYLKQHQLINHNQHGFLGRHSTCTQLLESIDDWSIAVDAFYCDFAEAFYSVSHTKHLHKLAAYGIASDLFNFLDDFLHNRTQRVALHNGVSSFELCFNWRPARERLRVSFAFTL